MGNRAIEALDKWHHTKTGLAAFGLLELAVSYVLVSLAIDSGSLWQYGLALILLVGSLMNFAKLLWAFISGRGRKGS